MSLHEKPPKKSVAIRLIPIGFAGLILLVTVLLQGNDVRLLNPAGRIASEQRHLLIVSTLVLLVIAIPTLTLFYFTAWKYRDTSRKAPYNPNINQSKKLIFTIWAAPFAIMIILASIMWPATHRLAPQKHIDNGVKPLTVQVIAMRWKWLFIYPEQNIATVNYVQIPVDTPVRFEITADETPMSSFWIPHLGGQLYAMTGHTNLLNLIAEEKGDFEGSTAEINGAGFAGMKFIARASTLEDFNTWVGETKSSSLILDDMEYKKLLVPSENNQMAVYSEANPDIYNAMLIKYMGSQNQHTGHK